MKKESVPEVLGQPLSYPTFGKMTDPEKHDHWELLANELGAEVPPPEPQEEKVVPEEDQAEEATASAGPAPEFFRPAEPTKSRPRPVVERPATDWSALAEELGVEVTAEPDEPETTPTDEDFVSEEGLGVTPELPAESEDRGTALALPPEIRMA